MLIKSKKKSEIKSWEITPESAYLNRREFMKTAGLASAGLGLSSSPFQVLAQATPDWLKSKVESARQTNYRVEAELTPEKIVTTYNNFYEFGTDKGDPTEYAKNFKTDPWSVEISGEVEKPGTYTLEDILKPHDMEDRIYRFRCVEAWSMVVPWVGFPLADLVKRFQPTSKAKYVQFFTLHDPKQMIGQRSQFISIKWPYVEGLRMDEAMNPLALMTVGVYGKVIPPQNGAPIRLIVPWKYGFKSIKSIVKIHFSETQPTTTWERLAPNEYGFYANVNPQVNHPRWSQARERALPTTLFDQNWQETLMFNGYQEEVADLYKDMDLRRFY